MLPQNCPVTDDVHIACKYAAMKQGTKLLCTKYVPFSVTSPSRILCECSHYGTVLGQYQQAWWTKSSQLTVVFIRWACETLFTDSVMHDIMAVFKECVVNDSSPSDTVVLGLKHDMWQIENAMKEFFAEKLNPFWCNST